MQAATFPNFKTFALNKCGRLEAHAKIHIIIAIPTRNWVVRILFESNGCNTAIYLNIYYLINKKYFSNETQTNIPILVHGALCNIVTYNLHIRLP